MMGHADRYLEADAMTECRWTPEYPDLDMHVKGYPFTAAQLEYAIAEAVRADAESKGKRSPLFATRYGVARRVTLQLAAHEPTDV